MKKFVKIFAVVLAVLMLGSVMIACDNGGTGEDTVAETAAEKISVTIILKDAAGKKVAEETVSSTKTTLGDVLDIFCGYLGEDAECVFDESTGLLTKLGMKVTLEAAKKVLSEYDFEIPVLLMPYLSGVEISVDCVATANGNLIIPRYKTSKRYSEIILSERIISMCDEIMNKLNANGDMNMPMNIQFKMENDKPYLLEINPRMSGGLQLSCKAIGINLPHIAMNELLGKEILGADGEIDRAKMASAIFNNKNMLKKVNNILHPAVNAFIINIIEDERARGELDFVFIEAALLIENGYDKIADELWYVYASEDTRRMRLKASRGYSDEKISDILEKQLDDATFREHCQFVIDNSGSLEEAAAQIDRRLSDFRLK